MSAIHRLKIYLCLLIISKVFVLQCITGYETALSVRIVVAPLNEALVNGSRYVMSAGTFFENVRPRALLWCAFQIVVKMVYNLSIFNLHQKRCWWGSSSFSYCWLISLITRTTLPFMLINQISTLYSVNLKQTPLHFLHGFKTTI